MNLRLCTKRLFAAWSSWHDEMVCHLSGQATRGGSSKSVIQPSGAAVSQDRSAAPLSPAGKWQLECSHIPCETTIVARTAPGGLQRRAGGDFPSRARTATMVSNVSVILTLQTFDCIASERCDNGQSNLHDPMGSLPLIGAFLPTISAGAPPIAAIAFWHEWNSPSG